MVAIIIGAIVLGIGNILIENMFSLDAYEEANSLSTTINKSVVNSIEANFRERLRVPIAGMTGLALYDDSGSDEFYRFSFRSKVANPTGTEVVVSHTYETECFDLPADYRDAPELRNVNPPICNGLAGPTCADGIYRVVKRTEYFDASGTELDSMEKIQIYPANLGKANPGEFDTDRQVLAAAICIRYPNRPPHPDDQLIVEIATAVINRLKLIVWNRARTILFNDDVKSGGIEFLE